MATVAPPPPSGPRTDFFRQLKPICVPLSQITIRSIERPDAQHVLALIDALTNLWTAQASNDAAILDEKLAEYVFFPLSHLLRAQDQYPIRVIEAAIRLISSLIQYGWKAKLSKELAQQFLIFFSLTITGVPGDAQRRRIPEETIIESYRAVGTLITFAASSLIPASTSVDDEMIVPALGHSITVTLDGIAAGIPPLIQLEALQTLQTFFVAVSNNGVLARFLPGTVSALSRFLSPPSNQKAQKRVLIRSLEVLRLVLVTVLGDIKVRGALQKMKNVTPSDERQAGKPETDKAPTELTPAWLKATASQVKIALSAVLKLRSHESEDILSALDGLCIALLDECHSSLADCQSILVETAMMVETDETERSLLQTSLQDLAGIYPELENIIKSTLYNWVTGLPRQIQSNDDRVKRLAVRSILRGTKLAAALRMDSSTLDDSLRDSLRDSVVSLIRDSRPSRVLDDIDAEAGSLINSANTELVPYRPVLLDLEGQKATRVQISTLILNIGSSSQQVKLAASMLGSLRDSEGVDQISSFWLAFELLKATYAQTSDLDELFDLTSLAESKDQEAVFRELYDLSASILSSHSDSEEQDWRLEAIALEVTAFAASRLKEEFRPELIDVLYPVAACLGSQSPQLRRHAIGTLNRLALSCGYGSVSELIIDNVDYMVNSISLRLNTFDISPASTKVLGMMIRLTGPRLIPYLDDVVAAIFAALDNYHGYPVFVESLFSVLSEIVTQGTKSETLLQGATTKSIDHRKRGLQASGIAGILDTLEQRAQKAKKLKLEEDDDITGHPKQPWGLDQKESQAKSLLDSLESGVPEDGNDQDAEPPSGEIEKAPQTPTYTLLSRIMTLTQHYLTSPTPTLRKSLLDLVATVSPALAPDENAFLPMVNTLWPVVVARLQDPEPYVVIAACGALAGMCRVAGDFLSTRLRTEWGGSSGVGENGNMGLGRWFRKVKEAAGVKGKGKGGVPGRRTPGPGTGARSDGILLPSRSAADTDNHTTVDASTTTQSLMSLSLSKTSSPVPTSTTSTTLLSPFSSSLGRFSQSSQIWLAALRLLTAIVTYVRIDDDMYDEILGLVVVDVCVGQGLGDLRLALEAINPDAVWLAMYEGGLLLGDAPVFPGAVVGDGFEFEFLKLTRREGAVA